MRAFLRKLLHCLLMLLKAIRKDRPRATPPAVPVRGKPLEPSKAPSYSKPPAAPARERHRAFLVGIGGRRYHNRPVPDGKWVMKYHRGRH